MQVDRLSITMDPDLGKSVREAAARSGSSVSAWLAAAAANGSATSCLELPLTRGRQNRPHSATRSSTSSAGARSISTCSGQRRLMALVLDAGGLIAVDRLDRAVGAMLRVAQQEKLPVRTSAAVVAQVWRNGSLQANLARVLAGVDAATLDGATGRSVGEILALSKTADVVDGHLGLVVQSATPCSRATPRTSRRSSLSAKFGDGAAS